MNQKNKFPLIMKGTAVVCAMLTVVFATLFYFTKTAFYLSLAITAGTTCYHFSMRLLIGRLVPLAMREKTDPGGFWFRSRCFETKLYRLLEVRYWKRLLPTYAP